MLADLLKEPEPTEPPRPEPSPALKIVLLGDLGVGKTCLRAQFVHHVFSNAYKATIGGDFLTTTVEIGAESDQTTVSAKTSDFRDKRASRDPDSKSVVSQPQGPQSVSLQVWDTAGQERFNLISHAFYRGADVAILVYDITSYELLLSVRSWFARFLQHCNVTAPGVIIVGNKLDRAVDRAVDADEVKDVLCRNDPAFASHVTDWENDVFEVSCRTLASVEAVFKRAAIIGLRNAAETSHDRYFRAKNVVLDDAQAVSSRCAC